MVRSVLTREGFEVEVVQSGNEAIARLSTQRYAAVVLDVLMADGSGHVVLQTLATQRPDVKCVVVISAASAAILESMDVANVEVTLRKPFNIQELVKAVRNCLATSVTET